MATTMSPIAVAVVISRLLLMICVQWTRWQRRRFPV